MATVFHVTVLFARVSTGAFCVLETFCSEGTYEFYSLVTLASYAVGVQPDVKMTVVEVVE